MMNEKLETSEKEEVSLREIIQKIQYVLKYLFSKWIFILISLFIGAIVGYIYTYNAKTFYIAETTFIFEGQQSSQITGLAALFSGGATSSSGGSLFEGGTLLSLYTTRLMLEKALFTPVKSNDSTFLYIDWYLRINDEGDKWNDIPEKNRGSKLSGIISTVASEYVKVEPGSFVKISVKSKDELFSKGFNEILIKTVNDFYIYTKTKKILDNLKILEDQADSISKLLIGKMSGAAIAADYYPNANLALSILKVDVQKRNLDVQAATSLYSSIITNLETTKMELRKETPLIQIVDPPFLPLKKEVPDNNKIIILFTIGSVLIMIGFLILYLFYKNIMFDEQV